MIGVVGWWVADAEGVACFEFDGGVVAFAGGVGHAGEDVVSRCRPTSLDDLGEGDEFGLVGVEAVCHEVVSGVGIAQAVWIGVGVFGRESEQGAEFPLPVSLSGVQRP